MKCSRAIKFVVTVGKREEFASAFDEVLAALQYAPALQTGLYWIVANGFISADSPFMQPIVANIRTTGGRRKSSTRTLSPFVPRTSWMDRETHA